MEQTEIQGLQTRARILLESNDIDLLKDELDSIDTEYKQRSEELLLLQKRVETLEEYRSSLQIRCLSLSENISSSASPLSLLDLASASGAAPVASSSCLYSQRNFPWSAAVEQLKHSIFRIHHWRPFQLDAINATLSRRDCFVIMPTGGGKSVLFQLPGLIDLAPSGRTFAVAFEAEHIAVPVAADFHEKYMMDSSSASFGVGVGAETRTDEFTSLDEVEGPDFSSSSSAALSSSSRDRHTTNEIVPKCQVTFIVSPLLALSLDQVSQLQQLGIGAAQLSSKQSREEQNEIFRKLSGPSFNVLRFSFSSDFIVLLSQTLLLLCASCLLRQRSLCNRRLCRRSWWH